VRDVEPDLRTLLREKAEEVRPDVRIPGPVLRRSRRRRVVTGLLAGALTVGAAAAVFVGARVLIEETTPEPREVRPAGTPAGFYPFIYPSTQEELDTTLSEVEQGSMPMWTDPRGAATLFAVNVLGWDPRDVMVDVRGDEPITAVIANPTLSRAAGPEADIPTQVIMAKVPGSQTPVYPVIGARAETMDLEPIGPDQEFGTGGTLAFRGRVVFVPEEGTVELTVQTRQAEAFAEATPDPHGRFEVAAEVPGGIGPDTVITVALVDGSGSTLTLTSARLASSIAAEPQAGSSGAVQVAPPLEIPPEVAATREAILDATQARDYAALRALIPDEGFTFSYGGERDPIAYWRRLESRGHVPVFGDILPMVLNTEPALSRGVYWWPAPAAEDPARWDEHDLDTLRQIHAEEDIRLFQEAGLYTGWRAGIDRDGTWVFFVSGD
jgi:hypothetical protein